MAYYNPHITALYNLNNQGFFIAQFAIRLNPLNLPPQKKTPPKRGSHQLLSRQLEAFGRFFGGLTYVFHVVVRNFGGVGR